MGPYFVVLRVTPADDDDLPGTWAWSEIVGLPVEVLASEPCP